MAKAQEGPEDRHDKEPERSPQEQWFLPEGERRRSLFHGKSMHGHEFRPPEHKRHWRRDFRR